MPSELDPAFYQYGRRETPTEGMKRIELEMRDRPDLNPGRIATGAGRTREGYNASIGAQGPVGGGVMVAADPITGQPVMVGGKAQAGPLSYQYNQPAFKGAPASQQIGVGGQPFDSDAYFGVTAQQGPGGRSYGANVSQSGEDGGWSAYGQYNPSRRDLNVGGGYSANFAEGGRASVGQTNAAGIPVTLETRKGDMRQRQDSGASRMAADYGYISNAKPDADGMKTDAFVGPHRDSKKVFVVNQQHPHTGKFNEHKVLLGYKDRAHALRDYAHSFSDGLGHKRIHSVVEMGTHELKDWLKKPHTEPLRKAEGGPVDEPAPVDDTVQLGEARPLTIRRGPAPISLAPRPETGEDYEAFVERQALNQRAKRQAALEAEAARPRELLEDVGRKFSEYTMPRAEDYTHSMDAMTRASTELTQSGKKDMLSGYEFLGAGKSMLGTALPVIAPVAAGIEAGLLKPAERTFGPAARHAMDVLTNVTPGPGTLATGTKILAGGIPIAKAAVRGGEETAAMARTLDDLARLDKEAPKIEEARAITKEHEPPVVQQAKAEQPITGGNEDLQFTNLEKTAKVKAADVALTEEEKLAINAMAEKNNIDPAKAQEALLKKKTDYPESDGWAPFEVADFERDGAKKVVVDEDGVPGLKLKKESYEFHGPEGSLPKDATSWNPAHVDDMADKLVKEVTAVADRADAGDKNGKVIMASRNWYSAMRDRLRQEYGGFADTVADILGTTSAQTGVRQNWENTIEVMSQFSRGAYDRTLTKLDEFLKAGGEMGSAGTRNGTGYINRHLDELKSRIPEALKKAKEEGITDPKKAEKRAKEIAFQETQQGDFPLITKADGKTLFNANSPPTMLALLDKFRERKAGDAPKTPNFTGNLIGYSDKATIDVWAARLLRRLSERKRIVPEAEHGVGGDVLGAPLPSGIGVGGEFGFGQEVFKKAAERLRQDPRFDNLGDDDLQAIAWFLEKEQWGKNSWTNKTGEGGSIELEANFAGVNDREALKELRRIAETDPTFAERAGIKKYLEDEKTRSEIDRANEFYEENKWILDLKPTERRDLLMKQEGLDKDEATKAANALVSMVKSGKDPEKELARKTERLGALTQRAEEASTGARQELERIQSIARRFTAGLSAHREATPATAEMFREGPAAIENVLRQDPAVIMSKATTSRGRYIDRSGDIWDEPSWDIEFVTRQDFSPQPVFRDMVEQAKKRDQDSMFLSEVVKPGTVDGANPGIEVYFTKKVDDATAEKLTELINKLKVDAGFTFVTDYKAKNRAAAGQNVGEYVGMRLQYVPEFGVGREYTSHLAAQATAKMLDAIEHISSVDGVSSARYVEYDTQVLFRDQYDAYLAGSLPNGRKSSWSQQSVGQGDQAANRLGGANQGAASGEVLRGELPAAKSKGFAQGGPVAPIATLKQLTNVVHDLASIAHRDKLDQRHLAYLLKVASGSFMPPERAMQFAGQIMTGDIAGLLERFRTYVPSMRTFARLNEMMGGKHSFMGSGHMGKRMQRMKGVDGLNRMKESAEGAMDSDVIKSRPSMAKALKKLRKRI